MDCLQKQQDAKRGKPLQSSQHQHQRLKDLQVEVKALALKLERSAAPNNRTKKAVKAAKLRHYQRKSIRGLILVLTS
jgi:hypothetical protein